MDYLQIAITLFSSLVVAVVTAILTVKLSLRKFYAERWWERKADVYSRIVEALHRLKQYDEEKYEREMNHRISDNDSREEELSKQWKESNAELERAVDLGAFIVSAEVESIIRKFLKRSMGDPYNDPLFEVIEADLEKVEKCLTEVKSAAKKDLGVK